MNTWVAFALLAIFVAAGDADRTISSVSKDNVVEFPPRRVR